MDVQDEREGELSIFISAGATAPAVESIELPRAVGRVVAVSFAFGGSIVSLSFTADQFLALTEQLRRFAATMPGRPS